MPKKAPLPARTSMPTKGDGHSQNFCSQSGLRRSRGVSLPRNLSDCPLCSVRYGHFAGDWTAIARGNRRRSRQGAGPLTILQAWLFVGIPCLVVAFSLFYGRSRIRTLLGYLVLAVA